MKRIFRRAMMTRSIRIFLVLNILYFSQLYPFVHIHHSHDDDFLPFELSFHPIDIDFGDCAEHHDGEEHHHSIDTNIDWNAIRTQSRIIITYNRLYSLPNYNHDIQDEHFTSGLIVEDKTIVPQCVPIFSIDIRGPPFFA